MLILNSSEQTCLPGFSLSLYKICPIHQMQETIKIKNNKICSVQYIDICSPVVAVN